MTDQATTDLVRVEDWLDLMPELQDVLDETPEQTSLRIAHEILTSTSMDEAFADDEMAEARDLVGMPLELRGVKFNRSAYSDGPGIYAVIDAVVIGTGEVTKFTCGARNVIAQLLYALKARALEGYRVKIKESKPNAEGRTSLRMVRVIP